MRELPESSVDSVVTDPPYGIRFMGKAWDAPGIAHAETRDRAKAKPKVASRAEYERDRPTQLLNGGYASAAAHAGQYDRSTDANRVYQAWCEEWARECLRVLKPGGYLLSSGGTRTYHRLACAIEDAGFEIRDSISWLYGSGFPKSKNVGNGWGTALKPAHEPVIMARKPLSEGTVARNVLEHGTGAINVDGTRISTDWSTDPNKRGWQGGNSAADFDGGVAPISPSSKAGHERVSQPNTQGRWPANLILSHHEDCSRVGVKRVKGNGRPNCEGTPYDKNSEHPGKYGEHGHQSLHTDPDGTEEVEAWECVEGCPVAELDRQSGVSSSGRVGVKRKRDALHKTYEGAPIGRPAGADRGDFGDKGGASRFFYVAKASRKERNAGLDNTEIITVECHAWDREVQKVRLRVDTGLSAPKVIAGFGIQGSSVSEWNTFLFGNGTTVPSLTESKFIILTGISSITESATLKWLTRSLTNESIADANSAAENGGSPAESVENSSTYLSFTSGETVSLPGARHVPSATPWIIRSEGVATSDHPTVKPIALMRYLVRMVTPPGGTVLDPFTGSGSTGCAAVLEGMDFIGIEREEEYVEIAKRRIEHHAAEIREKLFS